MGSLCIQRPGERERGEKQRKMKVTVVLFAACVASLRATAVHDASTTTAATTTTLPTCPDACCPFPTTTTIAPTTTTAAGGDDTTTTAAGGDDTTTTAAGGDATTSIDCSAYTADTCTCLEDEPENGAESASLSILALLFPAFLARLV